MTDLSRTPPEQLKSLDAALQNRSDEVIEQILMTPETDDKTVAYIAERVPNARLIERVAANEARILRSPEIVEALSNNPFASRHVLDKVISLVQGYLEKKEGLPKSPAADSIENSPSAEDEISGKGQEEKSDDAPILDVAESFLDKILIPENLTAEEKEEAPASEVKKKQTSAMYQIRRMTIPERIKLAMMGNADSRRILIRDQNRIVVSAVLRNPRVPDSEIVTVAQIKSLSEDVLREISSARKWTKLYPVKVALVNNPKTPSDAAIGFLRHLRDRELHLLLQNREIPGVVLGAARKLVKERREQKS